MNTPTQCRIMASTEKQFGVSKLNARGLSRIDDLVAVESPLTISITFGSITRSLGVTMRTPGRDRELAIGFLYSEGLIDCIDDVIETKSDIDSIDVVCRNIDEESLSEYHRISTITSSCGICGKDSISNMLHIHGPKLNDGPNVSSDSIYYSLEELRTIQPLFNSTGGSHASAIATAQGDVVHVEEDVGRHNALDKLVGHMLLSNMHPVDDLILIVSGRASFELVHKAIRCGFSVMIAVGAPSSLAVDMAREHGLTLVGFARGESFTIYSSPSRVSSS